jgi:hypothetical protein
MCFLESQVIAHNVQPGFVNFFVHAEFRMMNVDISLSSVRVYCILCMSMDVFLTSV